MRDPKPLRVEVRRTLEGVRFELPGHRVGGLRFLGLVPVVFGLGIAGFAAFWIGSVLGLWEKGWPGNAVNPVEGFKWAMAAFGLLFVGAGFKVVGFGFFLWRGRVTLEIRDDRLWCVWKAFLFRRKRSEPLDRIESLEIGGLGEDDGDVDMDRPMRMTARLRGGSGWVLAGGYPHAFLIDLADQLVYEIEGRAGRDGGGIAIVDRAAPGDHQIDEASRVSSASTASAPPAEFARPARVDDPPAGSRAVLETHADGLTVTLPPAGVLKGSRGLFWFSMFWCGFMSLFSPVWFLGGWGAHLWFVIPFLALFWAIGLAMFFGALNMGCRHARLEVSGDRLKIVRRGPFGGSEHHWRADELKAIRVGPSGMSINNRCILNLHVVPRRGTKQKLFAGRDEDELRWLAAALRARLSVGGQDGGA